MNLQKYGNVLRYSRNKLKSILYLVLLMNININEFFDIVEEFFDAMHPNYCDVYVEENTQCQLWKICEEFFEQIGPQI